MIRTTLIVGLLALAVSAYSPCPQGWFYSQKFANCYVVPVNNASQPLLKNWTQSETYCTSIGGHLASIDSTYDFDDVIGVTNNSIYNTTWFGQYRKTDNASTWYNIDGTYAMLNSKWLPGEPAAEGNCACIRSTIPTGYRAQNCGYKQPFLCRQKAAVCQNKNYTGATGQITSPNYPNNYENNLDCFHTITGPVGTYITLNFDVYFVEDYYDYVLVYDGAVKDSAHFLGEVDFDSWLYYKDSFKSTGNQISVYFHTDYMIVKKGWHATWSAKTLSDPIRASGYNGSLASPNYPSSYPSYAEQLYYISTPTGAQISVVFDFFYTERKYDYLEIYDSSVVSSAKLIANISGSLVVPFSYNSSYNYLTMRFMSDAILNYKGFHLNWNIF